MDLTQVVRAEQCIVRQGRHQVAGRASLRRETGSEVLAALAIASLTSGSCGWVRLADNDSIMLTFVVDRGRWRRRWRWRIPAEDVAMTLTDSWLRFESQRTTVAMEATDATRRFFHAAVGDVATADEQLRRF